METHSSIPAWKISWVEGYIPQSHKDWTQLSTHTCTYIWGFQSQLLSPLLAGWCLMSVKPLKACWSPTRKSTSWCKGTEWVDFWSRQCPFRGSSTDLTTAPDGLCSLWLVRQWLSFSPGISARGWYFMWLQEIQLHQSSLTKGSILIQGVCGWYSRANVTIQRTWFFSFTSSDIFCPQSGKMATSASASCQNWRQKEQTQKEDRMALLLQKQSQPTGLVLPPLGHMLTPNYMKYSTIQYFTWVHCCEKQNCSFVSNEEGTNASELMSSSTCHMSWGEFALHIALERDLNFTSMVNYFDDSQPNFPTVLNSCSFYTWTKERSRK